MLVTVASYRDITADHATDEAVVTARIERSVRMIEEHLGGRLLESAEREETVVLERECGTWRAYPRAIPLFETNNGEIYDDVTITDVTPDASFGAWGSGTPTTATIIYRGGFTAETLPATLQAAICDLAYSLGNPSSVPVNAISVRSGDQSVTYAKGTHPLDGYLPGLWDRIKKYRRPRRHS